MVITIKLSFLLLLISVIKTQNSTSNLTNNNSSNISIADSYKCNNSKLENLTIGEEVVVCIHFYPLNSRIAFKTKVDQYEMLTITGGYLFSDKSKRDISFIAQFGNYSTPYPSLYFHKGNNSYSQLFNIVIKIDKGKINGVDWDNDCWDCGFDVSGNKCIQTNNLLNIYNSSEYYSENVSILLYYYIIF